ncbi:MAG: SIS domain-containing protein [Thermoplasmata archaeon]|nr:SIS domain-containing protein [Thermoplasmata archaeon]
MSSVGLAVEEYVRRYVEEACDSIREPYLAQAIAAIVPVLLRARAEGRTLFFLGNGGSASTASHFVVDIGKATIRGDGRRFRCIGLVDNVETLTAWANDTSYARVFSEQVRNLASRGDVLFAITGSGNSPNVLAAVELARKMGLHTIGLTGLGGGKLKGLVDIPVVVPSQSMQHAEDVHLLICHLLTAYLRDEGPEPPPA